MRTTYGWYYHGGRQEVWETEVPEELRQSLQWVLSWPGNFPGDPILPAKGPTIFFHSHIEELRMGSWLICICRNGDSEGDRKEWTWTASALELRGTIVLVLSPTSCLRDRKCSMDQERQRDPLLQNGAPHWCPPVPPTLCLIPLEPDYMIVLRIYFLAYQGMVAFNALSLATDVAGQSGATPLPSQNPNYLIQTFKGDPLLRELKLWLPST